jgi:hypothetical protein
MEWAENGFVIQQKRLVPAYHKMNFVGIQNLLRDKLPAWENNA